MNFREEYKGAIEIMSPSAEQTERMKNNILQQIKEPQKKAIPFKKIAYIGTAVAACAVISVAAFNIIPRLSGGSSELTTASGSSIAVNDTASYADYDEENTAVLEMAADASPEYAVSEMNGGTATEDGVTGGDMMAEGCDAAGCYEPSDTAAAGGSIQNDAETTAPSTTTIVAQDYAQDPCVDADKPYSDEAMTASDDVIDEAPVEFGDGYFEVGENYEAFVIEGTKYARIPDDISETVFANNEAIGYNKSVHSFVFSDGTTYTVTFRVRIITIELEGELLGLYCEQEYYDEIIAALTNQQ